MRGVCHDITTSFFVDVCDCFGLSDHDLQLHAEEYEPHGESSLDIIRLRNGFAMPSLEFTSLGPYAVRRRNEHYPRTMYGHG